MNKIFFHIENHNQLPNNIKFDNISNIDSYENKSIDHVILQDLLDYYSDNLIIDLLSLIKNKIADGGHITIQSIDIKQLSIAVAFDEIDTNIVKGLLYPNKKSMHTINDIEQYLKSLNFTIQIKKYINLFEYYILAQKHE